jgi:hypothetical protein
MVKSWRLQWVKPVISMARQEMHREFALGTSWKHSTLKTYKELDLD